MTTYDATISKIGQLPESLLQEVSDFVEFLLVRQDSARWQMWNEFSESVMLSVADFSSYLSNLEDYEDRLARGEIRW